MTQTIFFFLFLIKEADHFFKKLQLPYYLNLHSKGVNTHRTNQSLFTGEGEVLKIRNPLQETQRKLMLYNPGIHALLTVFGVVQPCLIGSTRCVINQHVPDFT